MTKLSCSSFCLCEISAPPDLISSDLIWPDLTKIRAVPLDLFAVPQISIVVLCPLTGLLCMFSLSFSGLREHFANNRDFVSVYCCGPVSQLHGWYDIPAFWCCGVLYPHSNAPAKTWHNWIHDDRISFECKESLDFGFFLSLSNMMS